MNTNEKNIAIQEIKDIQQTIEQLESDWTKATEARNEKNAEMLNRRIELLLAKRRGMEAMLTSLKVEYDRKDYRVIELDGTMSLHTMWYLI